MQLSRFDAEYVLVVLKYMYLTGGPYNQTLAWLKNCGWDVSIETTDEGEQWHIWSLT